MLLNENMAVIKIVSDADFDKYCSQCWSCENLSSVEEILERAAMMPSKRKPVRIRCRKKEFGGKKECPIGTVVEEEK